MMYSMLAQGVLEPGYKRIKTIEIQEKTRLYLRTIY